MPGEKKQGDNADAVAKKKRAIIKQSCFTLAWVISVALLAGAVVFFVLNKNDHQEKEKDATVDMEQEKQKWTSLRNAVLDEFSPVDEQFAVEIHNPSSAEWKALHWMALKDETEPTSQRYATVVIWTHFGLALEPQKHECQWDGVECRDQVAIGLNFTGMVPFQMALPRSLAYLPSLETLHLAKHGVKGSIPTPCHQQWKILKKLNLEENKLTSVFSGLEDNSWTSLQYLNVKNNILDETVPKAFTAMTDLRELYLKGNEGLTGPVMEYVVPSLPQIESIDISRTAVSGSIPDYVGNGSMRHLTKLIADFTQLSGSLPESLSVATNLTILSLGGTDAFWTGTLPSSYDKLSMLEFVALNNFKGITGTLPASWGETWRSLMAFDLWGTPELRGTLPPEWSDMTSLSILRLMDNQLTSTIPTEYGKLTNLRDLSLHKSNLTGEMPQEICDLRAFYQLTKLFADCKEGLDGSAAAIACSVPDCCTFCSASLAGGNWGN